MCGVGSIIAINCSWLKLDYHGTVLMCYEYKPFFTSNTILKVVVVVVKNFIILIAFD